MDRDLWLWCRIKIQIYLSGVAQLQRVRQKIVAFLTFWLNLFAEAGPVGEPLLGACISSYIQVWILFFSHPNGKCEK